MIVKDKILVVDDDLDAVDAMMRAFEHEGFEVYYAKDGLEGLEQITNTRFQLILLDIMMPRMNGYELMKRLRENELTIGIPVIFVTAYFNTDEIVKGLEAGAVDAISKPFRIAEVLIRGRLRIAEAKLKRRYSPIMYFFSEAQEKEQSKRTGVFEFYDKSRSKVGDIYVEDGRLVYATSKEAIKEDAFLQLTTNRELLYLFQDDVLAPKKTLSSSITSLILEASKIMDELDSRELRDETVKRILIVDKSRIPRVLASRSLKSNGFTTMVTSSEEISNEILEKFDPDLLVMDHQESQEILGKIILHRAVPVITYYDPDLLDEAALSSPLGPHQIDASISKANLDYALPNTVVQLLRSN